MGVIRHYEPSPTAIKLHEDGYNIVKIISGHVGGGKSVMCCHEVFAVMMQTPVCKDGKRYARAMIIRQTYAELATTTVKTWLHWFPEDKFGRFYKKSPFLHAMKFYDEDGVFCDFEVYFTSMDRVDDTKKVLSLELTLFYINELREFGQYIIEELLPRLTGRYPSKEMLGLDIDDDSCAYYQCVVADTNAPNRKHWIKSIEDGARKGWVVYKQPPAMIPAAQDEKADVSNGLGDFVINPGRENRAGSSAESLIRIAQTLSDERFKVYILNEYGSTFEGKPVHPEYNTTIHRAKDIILPTAGCMLYIGWDYGATPACVVCQLVAGRMIVLDAWQAEHSDLSSFVDTIVIPVLLTKYSNFMSSKLYVSTGDPAGKSIVSHEIITLNNMGIATSPAASNEPAKRRYALTQWLNRNSAGQPCFQVSHHVDFLDEGLAGGFKYKEIGVISDSSRRYHDVPDKNIYSHSCEALEYALMPLYYDTKEKTRERVGVYINGQYIYT